ncbi:interleukin-6 receptor subunit alpha-like isoform X2 [Denticeps clupeoides]|uniref:interleukin-6 receptor subunit alpha-like isoform X2 n=1 Tax=Denticeps clupeoides TaxID=299321 RepID=UPI0010A43700|nr:interleukin-6 receptor subunit alpha-like isoform X2 [Denticeps clupeoides]
MKNNNMGLWKQCTLVLTTLAFAKSSLDVTCRRRVPPQKPGLTCYRTSPNHKIRCEWSFPERLTPAPRCYLLLKKRRQSGQCSYSVTHNKCWCVLDTKRGLDDNSEYVAQLCVTSTAGNATSPDIHFTATGILKPDPPAQVKVRGVEGGSRMLTVSWSYPASWKQDNFFSLNFQLRYRPVSGEKHQIIDTLQLLSYEILDVIPHTEYELQLRAIEEYHNGMWSDWTSPVYARTWTGAEPTTFYNSLTHLEPLWPFHESSGLPPEEEGSGVDPLSYIAGDTLRFPSLWVCGGCVLIVLFLLLAAYTIRHREHFLSKIGKIGSHPPQHPAKDSSSQLPAQEHNSLAVALWPTSSPQQPRDSPLGENIASDGAHFHNMDYFLVQNE